MGAPANAVVVILMLSIAISSLDPAEPLKSSPQIHNCVFMNVPNALTVFRIILGIIVPYLMWYGGVEERVFAAVLFGIAAFTDWLDGWYARRYNLITKIGKILDPIADKVLVLGSFVVLSDLRFEQMYSIWWIVPIFLR